MTHRTPCRRLRGRLVRVAPHVELLRRAADVDRDRLQREPRVEGRLGGGSLFDLVRLGGSFTAAGSGSTSPRPWRCRVASRVPPPWRRPSASLPRPRFGLVRVCCGNRLLGARELGVGAPFELFQLAERGFKRCRLTHRSRGGFLRLIGCPGGLHGLADERLGACRRSREGLRIRREERRVGELDRAASFGEMITRIPIRVLPNSFSAKPNGIRMHRARPHTRAAARRAARCRSR